MSGTNILIVDDHPVFRQGLRDLLETDDSMHVVGEAADGEASIQLAIDIQPDVILMDINLPTINGLQVSRKIKSQLPKVHIVMITGYDDETQMFHAFRCGASAYCAKDTTPEQLLHIVQTVQQGKFIFDGKVMTREEVITWFEQKSGRHPGTMTSDGSEMQAPLSPREMEILENVPWGLSNKEIAMKLGISHQTVKNHMTAILRKLNVDDRTQAAIYALKHGWVRLDNTRPS